MRLTHVAFEELQKDRANSPEDSFVRSTITYEENGKVKRFHVLYPGVFAETAIKEFWNYETPIHEAIALNLLSSYPNRKRLYISSENEFLDPLKKADLQELLTIIHEIKTTGLYLYLNKEKMPPY
ncbi:hypothetical protein [Guptibacillus hwajinpoensis]|uniref:hypothetical protein n=1 Tax=Guptibacillus hwajinpoensis TaxID=208199 RepID=UPI00384AE5DA